MPTEPTKATVVAIYIREWEQATDEITLSIHGVRLVVPVATFGAHDFDTSKPIRLILEIPLAQPQQPPIP